MGTMRGIGRSLLYSLGALALIGAGPAIADESCATGTLEAAGVCLEPMQDDALLSVSGTGQSDDAAQYDSAPGDTAVILWDEFRKPRVSTDTGRVSQSMTVTDNGVRLNLSQLAGDL
jgi:hypothetical protein